MKKFPYPDKKLETSKEVKAHYEHLVFNALSHLNIAEYRWNIALPNEEGWHENTGSGASITVEYPYKIFTISIQQDSLDKSLKFGPGTPYWVNAERSIFHECIHILNWRLSELARKRYVTPVDIDDEEESLTDHLANSFYTLLSDWRAEKNGKVIKAKKRKKP